jgi:hypothetical protein
MATGTHYRRFEKELALPNIQFLQVRWCLYSIPRRPHVPLLPMCSSEVQDCCWWSSAFSGFKGQVLDSQSQAPCNPMLRRRGCQEHNKWQGWSCTECLHLLPFRSSRPTACPVLPSNTHQHRSPVSARLSKCVQTDVYHVICSAHFVKWVTKGNRPISIIEDGDLRELLTAG